MSDRAAALDLNLGALPPLADELDGVEVVEHKGVGHPDTICDALAESFGIALARYYRAQTGALRHFNVDKALLAGGAARPAFGGGEVTAPIQMLMAGRAAREVAGRRVPIEEIAREAGVRWMRENMHALDPERHVAWSCLVRGGSDDLVSLFDANAGCALANDTSIGVGYAPLSPLERAVLAVADRLKKLARETPAFGEDVKVMGIRRGPRYELTIACAFVGAHVASIEAYAARRDELARLAAETASAVVGTEVAVAVNAADDLARGRAYLTVTGTSAEAGDDGEVGRGNRVNGLITPYRPMSLEAAAGKNPVSHVGKLYNVLAHRIAHAIVTELPAVGEARCFIVSRIGRRVDEPAVVDVRLRMRDGRPANSVRTEISAIVDRALGSVGALSDEMLLGGVRVY